jgi:hypothetical protein
MTVIDSSVAAAQTAACHSVGAPAMEESITVTSASPEYSDSDWAPALEESIPAMLGSLTRRPDSEDPTRIRLGGVQLP